jgi:hypothetical protein
MKGHPEIFSETAILTFSSPIPDRVKIAVMSYRVRQSNPVQKMLAIRSPHLYMWIKHPTL